MDDTKMNGTDQSTGEELNETLGAVEQEVGHAIDHVVADTEVAADMQADGVERQVKDGDADDAAASVAHQAEHDIKH